jgi:saccharopine dehydrogenase (NAD+, L-glutamate forming)
MNHDRKLDVVLYGASGFTGGLVADYLTRARELAPARWALAGRNLGKLQAVQARLFSAAGASPEALIVADAADQSALARLAEAARVVITTVGPYVKYGEPLVRACAEAGTDYVDLTGEPPFAAAMAERHGARAEQTGARIVHACGFDSIPHDLGAWFTLQALRARMTAEQRERTAVTIEGFVRTRGSISGGTWHSALEIMASMRGYAREERRRAAARAASERRARQLRVPPAYRRDLGFWAVPMPTIDPIVVLRSAELLPEYGPDFRYGHYLGLEHGYQVAGLLAGAGTVFALAQLPPTRKLLQKLKHPGEGPDEETRRRSHFRVIFQGRAEDQRVQCEVRGGDPGYGETAKMLAESALCLAFDRARLPARAGVLTPMTAIGEALIERLQRAGISFRETAPD